MELDKASVLLTEDPEGLALFIFLFESSAVAIVLILCLSDLIPGVTLFVKSTGFVNKDSS